MLPSFTPVKPIWSKFFFQNFLTPLTVQISVAQIRVWLLCVTGWVAVLLLEIKLLEISLLHFQDSGLDPAG